MGIWHDRGYRFDSESGHIYNNKGNVIGAKHCDGYLKINYRGHEYLAHRVIFEEFYGWLPECVDHINHNKTDNRISNLRAANKQQNNMNKKPSGDLPLGVNKRFNKAKGKDYYFCQISCEDIKYRYCTIYLDKAVAWRLNKEKELFGEFQYKVN